MARQGRRGLGTAWRCCGKVGRDKARHYNCVDYLEHIHLCGASLDEIETKAKKMARNSLLDFEGPYDKWLAEIGRPF